MRFLDLDGLSPDLLQRYDRPGPRYTSYPTAPLFNEAFGPTEYREQLRLASQRADEPLSMYVHLPFCHERCTFCGCNVVISPRRGPEEDYLDTLERELELLAESLGPRRSLNQLHWGGGTPTFLSPQQCERLFGAITSRFPLTAGAEVAIEVDPCVTTMDHLSTLARLGFNRISMGLQDTNPEVQRAVKRIQPLELTRDHVVEARRLGFTSVNIDLIYGLPLQTAESFRDCVQSVIAVLAPDRVACFSYAHVPWIKPHQKQLDETRLPGGWEKFSLFTGAAREFVEAGYAFIGFDHFARPDDDLARALAEDRIHRNFMGYTVMPAADQVGVGVTAIGDVAGSYAANIKILPAYKRAIDAGRFPIERGLVRSAEDELRGAVIRRLICTLRLDFDWVETGFGIDPRVHFADALEELVPMAEDGLVEIGADGLKVTSRGRFFLRNLCMPFDAYLRQDRPDGPKYSRTV
jgi:oxygen-independent coproporphyrinogen-3 oxidase